MPHCLFYLQSGDLSQPDQAGESGFSSPQPDLFTPPVEGIQVTDVFYEDTVNSSPLETTTSATAVSAATVMPGNFFCPELVLLLQLFVTRESFRLINVQVGCFLLISLGRTVTLLRFTSSHV